MKSLKQHIVELNQSEWDYYSDYIDRELQNPFSSKISHIEFAKRFFKRSGKSQVLEIINFLPGKKLDNERTKHTSSIFFLGILFYERTNLKSPFFEEENTAEYRRFPFLWFLACLFHDFGFTIEDDKTAIQGISSIKDLKQKYKIQNSLLEVNPTESSSVLFSQIEPYFHYSLIEREVIDHGIFAGLYFYDRLIKIRKSKIAQNDTKLFWKKELEGQYAQVASAIATHNIWLPEKHQHKLYREYKLDKLVDNFKPINFEEFPLLYLLGIVDTIDPMKLYRREGHTPNEILNSLNISFNSNIVTIINGKKSKLDFSLLTDIAQRLNGWINVRIKLEKSKLKLILY